MCHHAGHDHTRSPTINPVVIAGIGKEQLWSFIVEGADFDIVFLVGEVELAQAEVDDLELFGGWVYEHVVRLNVAMHYSVGVQIVQRLSQLRRTYNSCFM